MDQTTNSKTILRQMLPYINVYTDGTVERLLGTGIVPPGLDPQTSVVSKDIVILPETGISARIYHPDLNCREKLPLVVYFHCGAFVIGTIVEPLYHQPLNLLAKQAKAIIVSVNYRLAPENPLPACYDDAFAALQWVASHVGGSGVEPWVREVVDFDRVFLGGDSCGANMCHHVGMRNPGFKISGIVMVHPYFWGEEAIGLERDDPEFKSRVDGWWRFVCPSNRGCDDPLINPLAKDAPSLEKLMTDRIMVCAAEIDIFRERAWCYYRDLAEGTTWKGKAEFYETPGEGHIFHIFNHDSENTKNLIRTCAEFINQK